jgi:hypothetical protein
MALIFAAHAAALAIAAAQPAAAQHQYVEGQHYWFKPATFPGTAAPSPQQGPRKAKGAVIWNDGYSPDKPPAEKVAPVAQVFAEAGWDCI